MEDTPKTSICLSWQNVHHQVTEFGRWPSLIQKKCLLSSLSGSFQTGSLNGLMGPSGAGKTTLLNCLAGKTPLSGDGSIFVSNLCPSVVSYSIEQHVNETILSSFTVRQTLEYAFKFKNGHNKASMNGHIEAVMSQLMLSKDLSERKVAKLSGGELKRLAIAQELMSLTRPDFLFVDEPTTGLDSAAALQVMNCLKRLTERSMTIIVSIHVPNQAILQLFDKLYVLAMGGLAIYSAPPAEIANYLQIVNVLVPEDQMPVETLIELACREDSPVVQTLAGNCRNWELQIIASQASNLHILPVGFPNNRKSFHFSDFLLQLSRYFAFTFIIGWKAFLKQLLVYICVMLVFLGMFDQKIVQPNGCVNMNPLNNETVTCFNQLDNSSLLNENINFLNLAVHIFVYIVLANACVAISPFVKVFSTEHRNRWYSLGTFYFSLTIVSLLQVAISVVIIALLIYFASGQYTIDQTGTLNWTRIGHYLLCLLLYSFFTQSIGWILGVHFLNSTFTALISSIIIHVLIQMINDFYFKSEEIDFQPFVRMTDYIGVKYLIRYLVYIFYGINRCEETQFSYVLVTYEAGDDVIYSFTTRMIANILLLRIAAFILMYGKFSCNFHGFRKLTTKILPENFFKEKTDVKINKAFSKNEPISTLCQLADESEPKFSLLPQSLILAWRNLTLFGSSSIFDVNNNSSNSGQTILQKVTGQFHFGTLTALMGPSGAGKTSLLRVLNGQFKDRLSVETQLFLNKSVRIRSCFLTQEVSDHLWPGLTAMQALIFASKLKNATVDGKVDHDAIARRLLDELGLTGTADTKSEKCSGGERKRLALAQELTALSMPNLVCIDEPTSGLDSNSAEAVIACLRSLASRHHIAIVASVHQPNSRLVRQFNQIYVLAQGGVCIYSGPPNDIHSRLSQVPETISDDAMYSHETLITYSSLSHENSIVQNLVQLNNQKLNNTLLTECSLVPDGIQQISLRFSFVTFVLLFRRNLATFWGSQLLSYFIFCAFLLFFGQSLVIFWHLHKLSPQFLSPFCLNLAEDNTATNGSDCSTSSLKQIEQFRILRLSGTFIFFVHIVFLILNSFLNVSHFFSELPRLANEHRNGWYSAGTFYLMKSLFKLLSTLPILCLYFYITSLFESIRPNMFWYTVTLMSLSVFALQGMSHVIVILFSGNLPLQYMMQISIQLVFGFVGNFFVALPHLHYVYRLLAHFSIVRYTFEALTLLVYGFGRCEARKEIQPLLYGLYFFLQ